MDAIESLVGAQVNFVRFSYQVDINLLGGTGRNGKSANIQIEAPFQLTINDTSYRIEPASLSTLAPVINLLHTSVAKIAISEDYTLYVSFSSGATIVIAAIPMYEAWHIDGDDLPFFVANAIE